MDAPTYMLGRSKAMRPKWERACELLLAEADVVALRKALGLALFHDAKLLLRNSWP